jgi:uncharacterized protein YggU (UPF0235/DUF167 family)
VGGCYGEGCYGEAGDDAPALVVAVTQRAVGGAATSAVLAAVARAFGARPRDVHLVTGERSRTKVLELDPVPPGAPDRLVELLDGPVTRAGMPPSGRPGGQGTEPGH